MRPPLPVAAPATAPAFCAAEASPLPFGLELGARGRGGRRSRRAPPGRPRSNSRLRPRSRAIAPHLPDLVGEHEADPGAAVAGAAGAADPVHVGVLVAGGVEVDHVGDVGDVDAAGGDVGGDQGVDLAPLEAGQRSFALALALVAVHRDGIELAAAQSLDQPVGAALGADEDEGAAALGVAAAAAARWSSLALWDSTWTKLCSMSRLPVLGRLLGVAPGVVGVGGGELAGRALQGGGEEQGLAIVRGLGDDPADRRLEAHVEHAVGLVEDEDAGPGRARSRCGRAGPRGGRGWRRRCRRGGRRCSAGRSRRRRRRRRCGACGRGRSSRARRRSGWPARGSAPGPGRRGRLAGLDPVDHRDAEGERLARAGRGLDQEVVAGERVADDQLLDGEGRGDVARGERVDDRL